MALSMLQALFAFSLALGICKNSFPPGNLRLYDQRPSVGHT